MSLSLKCPQCTASLRVGRKYSGKQIHCPQCGGQIDVPGEAASPTPAGSRSPAFSEKPGFSNEPAGDESAPFIRVEEDRPWRELTRTGGKGAVRRRSRSSGMFIGLSALGVVVLGAAAVLLVSSNRNEKPEGAADEPPPQAPLQATNDADSPSRPSKDDEIERGDEDRGSQVEDRDPSSDATSERPSTPESRTPTTPSGPNVARIARSEPAGGDVRSRRLVARTADKSPTTDNGLQSPPKPGTQKPEVGKQKSEVGGRRSAVSERTDQQPALAETESSSDPDGNLDPEDLLEKHSLRIVGARAAHFDEPKLADSLREADRARTLMIRAVREWKGWERKVQGADRQLIELKKLHGQLSLKLARLNTVNPSDVTGNNRLVGQLNAIEARATQLEHTREKLSGQAERMRSKAGEARATYVKRIMEARKLADSIEGDYARLADDRRLKEALSRLGSAAGESYEMRPSRGFEQKVRQLASLEDAILTGEVPLRRRGNSLFVNAVINGKHNCEMVVDSGATSVTLSAVDAASFGLKPDETAPPVIVGLADGSRVTARLITIPSMRVGKFTVKDVECVVLPPEAHRAEPLLGMSFLGNFQFQIDADAARLHLTRVETGEKTRSTGRSRD